MTPEKCGTRGWTAISAAKTVISGGAADLRAETARLDSTPRADMLGGRRRR
jgi:hypothetical protein